MSVLSDKWIRKMSQETGYDLILLRKNRLEEIISLMDFLLLDMMQEFRMNLKYLPMLILKLLILKILNQQIL